MSAGLWWSDEARGRVTSGVLVGGAGCLRLLAARHWTDRSRHDRQVRPDPRPRQWVHYRLDLLARGEATPLNDRAETVALKLALGEVAHRVPVSSTKSAIGHLLGAAGAVEAVATVLALRDRIAPPTIGWEEAEEGLDLDYVPGQARPLDIADAGPAVAISNSFGFGGHNVSLCLEAA